jgi:DNA invertase Pin-like site-specific DNA recombinase
MNVVIYGRVSTQNQDYKRQVNELTDHASKFNWNLMQIFAEKVSGGKTIQERPELSAMIEFVKENKVEKVMCWELSRIGRNTMDVLHTISILTEHQVSIYIHNINIETYQGGKINPMATFLIQVLTSVAEMEKTTIQQRMQSGYNNFRSNGGQVGRKQGYTKEPKDLLFEHKDIVKLLQQGYSVRKTGKLTDKSFGTVQKIKQLLK